MFPVEGYTSDLNQPFVGVFTFQTGDEESCRGVRWLGETRRPDTVIPRYTTSNHSRSLHVQQRGLVGLPNKLFPKKQREIEKFVSIKKIQSLLACSALASVV